MCGIMIMNVLKISSKSGDGPSWSSGSGRVGVGEDVGGISSESLNLSSKPLSRISRHFSSSGISMRGFCSVGGLVFRFDMGGGEIVHCACAMCSDPNMFVR